MFRLFLPIILIGLAITGFLMFTSPYYKDISLKKEQIKSYNEALDNSKALESERDKLTQQYNSFNPDDLLKLQKLLPDNVDNIRLILELEKIALPYGMVLKDVKYDASNQKDTSEEGFSKNQNTLSQEEYGILNLEFSTQGTYNNFISFIKYLESNLRIVDISSIQFSSSADSGLNPKLLEAYQFKFAIKTYWLKN